MSSRFVDDFEPEVDRDYPGVVTNGMVYEVAAYDKFILAGWAAEVRDGGLVYLTLGDREVRVYRNVARGRGVL